MVKRECFAQQMRLARLCLCMCHCVFMRLNVCDFLPKREENLLAKETLCDAVCGWMVHLDWYDSTIEVLARFYPNLL